MVESLNYIRPLTLIGSTEVDSQQSTDAIERFKKQFLVSDRFIHLNNAGQTPMSRPALEIIRKWADRFYEDGAHVWPVILSELDIARERLATFLGAKPTETVYFQSAAGALSQVALGLEFKAGDEIIVWDQEYPSNFYPWNEACRRSGAKLVIAQSGNDLSTPIENIEKCMTPRTRAIATSWVQYRSGAIIDLKGLTQLARGKGIFVCADIIQGAGCLPFDFATSGLDAACGGSHKWMCSAHGAGFMILREEHFARLKPLMVGAMTYGGTEARVDVNAKPETGPLRFEPGGKALLEILALGASAQLLTETGIDRIAQEAEWLAKKLLHGLRELGYVINSPHGSHHRGAILNFTPGAVSALKSLTDIEAKLVKNGVSFAKRPPGIRLAPHAMNSAVDIERVLKILSS
jgi:cysteine desulfurase/selenocysteine lyase